MREIGAMLLAIQRADTSDLSPAWYDTAQVVRAGLDRPGLLPEALVRAGLDTLLRVQHADGSWGYPPAPAGYRVVPTLAAAATALTAAGTARLGLELTARAGAAARAAIAFLTADPGRLAPATLPDTIAVEFIVPALLMTLAGQLPDGTADPVRAALRDHDAGVHVLNKLRAAPRLPAPAHYSMEVLGQPPPGFQPADYTRHGCVACSPAATAAARSWRPDSDSSTEDYLVAEGTRLGGAWPTVAPVTVFEAAWIAGTAWHAGIRLPAMVVARLAPWLAAQVGEDGCGAGPALAPDSDDTAIVLYALRALGQPASTRPLRGYERADYFATFPQERTTSLSANAHVLEVLCDAWQAGERDPFVRRGIRKATDRLLATQAPDGCWDDKWHASPFYATACCVFALRATGSPAAARAIARAVDWVEQRQRPDGSWGGWTGTREETAYALQILLCAGGGSPALTPGAEFLSQPPDGERLDVPLWHGKELYEPRRIVNASVLMTLDACRRKEWR